MCGIAGIFSIKGSASATDAKKMLEAMGHRGPDDSGISCFNTKNNNEYWVQPIGQRGSLPNKDPFNLILGHTRLSIIDLSAAGHQPMSTPDRRFWITYNGEIFNFHELKKQLQSRGYAFHSATDTEVLLYAYEEYGESCLEHLRGFFAFCIYDVAKKKLFIARDRLGLKPLKYYWDGKLFAFSSEIKALLQLPLVSRLADLVAIDQYLAYRYIPAPLTGIQNIYKLPSGCSMTLSLDNPAKEPDIHRYWLPQFEPKISASFEEGVEDTINLLKEAILIRLMSDVPLGIFLSGGIDSSCIIALLRRQFSGEIRTFSVGFAEDRFDERPFARIVARRYGTLHKELLVEPRPEDELKKIVWHFDEPFGDPSAIPSFYLTKAASSYVKVVLNGDGGDEIFAGYKRYYIHSRNRFIDYIPQSISKIPELLSRWIPCGIDKKQGLGKFSRILESVSGNLIETYPLRFSGFSYKMRQTLGKGNLSLNIARNGWPVTILTNLKETGAVDAVERLMALDQITYLPEDILVKSDLAGMAHSIECRSPFLDHTFVEWANRLPLPYKSNKCLLRNAMQKELPAEITKRKKAGFNPPLDLWMRTVLRPSLEEYLLSMSSPLRLFHTPFIKKMIDVHMSEKSNLGDPLWTLLALAIWLELNNIEIV